MAIAGMNHFTILTDDVDNTVRFYGDFLGLEPGPHDLLAPVPSELLSIWPISKRVNSPDSDDAQLLDEVSLPAEARK